MNKEATISIVGEEKRTEDTDATKTELITEGRYYKKGDKYYVSYQENQISSYSDNITTTLKIDGDRVSMTRFGEINTHMVFSEGTKHLGYYETPFGSFTIGVMSDNVDVRLSDEGGKIHIKYLLEIDNNTRATHDLTLSIKA
jgi:uncharacterized beta-barrel protein YwiB (DUF1934 family)